MPSDILHARFSLGDLVYLVTDRDEGQWMVTAITFRITGHCAFEISKGTKTYWAAFAELCEELIGAPS